MGGGWWPSRNASRPTVTAAMANTSTAATTTNIQTTAEPYPPPPSRRHPGPAARTPGPGATARGCDDRAVRGQSAGAAFVGRSGDLEVLLDAYARAGHGRGRGGPRRAARPASASPASSARPPPTPAATGARVLVGQCLDLEEGGLPYAPLVDMLRTLDRDLTPEEGAATLGPLRAFLGRAGEADPAGARRVRHGRARAGVGRTGRPGPPVRAAPHGDRAPRRGAARGPRVRGPALGRPLDARPRRRSSPAAPARCRCARSAPTAARTSRPATRCASSRPS